MNSAAALANVPPPPPPPPFDELDLAFLFATVSRMVQ
jgi:hypothetical protein